MVDEEHRRERRQRVLKGASIISGITSLSGLVVAVLHIVGLGVKYP
ncbi:hypothetical protein NKI46_25735 [Mesorhizobium sp. M0615]